MKIYNNNTEIQSKIEALKSQNQTVGLVPTMGALHHGHLALVKKGLQQNDVIVVSIFVNPTQFNHQEDLITYPRTLERDINLLKTVNNQILIYAPTVTEIYNNNVRSIHYDFDGLEFEMEGKFRKGHFDGVATIVSRLFNIIKPHKAYFGEKDFQQLQIIKKLVAKHNIPIEIVGCNIHRESDGLAMSSRNERLKPKHRQKAPFIYKTLTVAKANFETKSIAEISEWVKNEFAEQKLLELEYFIIADEVTLKPAKKKSKKKKYRAFIAVYADDVRLIDNIALN